MGRSKKIGGTQAEKHLCQLWCKSSAKYYQKNREKILRNAQKGIKSESRPSVKVNEMPGPRPNNLKKYSHGLDEETIRALSHQSNLALISSMEGDLTKSNWQQRKMLVREGLIRMRARRRWEFTQSGLQCLDELKANVVLHKG